MTTGKAKTTLHRKIVLYGLARRASRHHLTLAHVTCWSKDVQAQRVWWRRSFPERLLTRQKRVLGFQLESVSEISDVTGWKDLNLPDPVIDFMSLVCIVKGGI